MRTAEKYTRFLKFAWLPVGTRFRYRMKLYRKIEPEKSLSGVREEDNAVALFDSPQYRAFINPATAIVLVTNETADAVMKERGAEVVKC